MIIRDETLLLSLYLNPLNGCAEKSVRRENGVEKSGLYSECFLGLNDYTKKK